MLTYLCGITEELLNDDNFLEDLRKSLDYNPETGEFRWKIAAGRVRAGSLAGCVQPNGRLYIRFQGKRYQAHRLAWLLTHGEWPDEMIDHLDGNPLNNRISNLRDVSRSVNNQNQRKAQSRNSTGFLGVSFHKRTGKFQAQITLNGKDKHLGYFPTAELAHAAYLAAKREIHEGCTI